MSLTDGDKAIIKNMGFQVGEIISKRLREEWMRDLEDHQLKCPTMNTVRTWKILAVGVFIGGLLVGGGATATILNLLKIL